MNYILETERLTLREFNLNDTAFIIRLLNSPGWLKFIGERNVKTNEQAKNYLLTGPLKSYAQHGFGLCLVELEQEKTSVGMCGLIKRKNLESPDIGFAFLPEFCGKGYATEMAHAVIQFAKEKLCQNQILAITIPNNQSSIKLLQKIGLSFVRKYNLPDKNDELLLFTTDKKYNEIE